ncbi:site-specific integrase [Bradyrhizobium diazoefficiens]|uniref:Site-specific integrase n=1 Tax=Bradyrhizobium diazoefficiens TaxID=1355477 RepID=A0A810AT29_9BRAD|nr:site-specific integrase [Bradyrhizobium diazoefficiens]BBZ96186.1 site-specific integrase [Bradyrhizobium diazoefficiens]BCA13871.1 site-specific integrase [Bradyrhizobium diazoefficiens]BCE58281.1 site-specific integrase [Bradyrhizobium diazoefficiens]BCE66958.1 site-specific integrase [Bradyrhizobium diazoefficiens]
MNGRRYTATFHGPLTEARKELRRLLRAGDTGNHVEPSRLTVGNWIDQWIAAGAPGRKKLKVGQRTLERYEELLRVHVKPKLGGKLLQKLQASEIDQLYNELEKKLAPMTVNHVHRCFNSSLSTAERKGMIASNPMTRIEQLPSAGESDHGLALDEADLKTLVTGFRPSATMYAPVAVDASTGVRRNELLAFRWTDFSHEAKTLKVERALEITKKFGIRYKPPKTWRGNRTIALDDATVALLVAEREKHQRIMASLPDGAEVDLSLIRLPDDALIFPAMPGPRQDFDFAKPRDPSSFSKRFRKAADALGFVNFEFHHLRGTHATLLLDKGVPVHTVAERIGDDPAVLLRNYAKRKRKQTADTSVASVINTLSAGIFGP